LGGPWTEYAGHKVDAAPRPLDTETREPSHIMGLKEAVTFKVSREISFLVTYYLGTYWTSFYKYSIVLRH
jgi:hypothetical protein